MSRNTRIALSACAAACSLALLQPASATTITFDNVADGTNINTVYAGLGVTFDNPLGVSVDNPSSPNIFARASSTNASPGNVVSVFATGVPAFDARYGAVEAVFASGQRQVSIDAAILRLPEGLGTPVNAPKMEIYDVNNNFVTAVSWDFTKIAQPAAGGITAFETLSFTSASANIGKVRFLSGQPGGSPSNFGVFDNFSFTAAVPEPTTTAMFALGLLGLSIRSLRRQRAD